MLSSGRVVWIRTVLRCVPTLWRVTPSRVVSVFRSQAPCPLCSVVTGCVPVADNHHYTQPFGCTQVGRLNRWNEADPSACRKPTDATRQHTTAANQADAQERTRTRTRAPEQARERTSRSEHASATQAATIRTGRMQAGTRPRRTRHTPARRRSEDATQDSHAHEHAGTRTSTHGHQARARHAPARAHAGEHARHARHASTRAHARQRANITKLQKRKPFGVSTTPGLGRAPRTIYKGRRGS
jgi:hypothetical protein